jgi:hypothetical protein
MQSNAKDPKDAKAWGRPILERLGRIDDVAGSNAGNAEANASGALVRS